MRLIDSFESVFRYMANQGMTWPAAISELVDNSFDAGATRVEIKMSSASWQVQDDGKGCSDITKMLPLGSHFDQGAASQPVGMWGIGLKDAWAFSGREISITTVSRGIRGTLTLNAKQVDSQWNCPDPEYSPAAGESSGTTVRLQLDRKRRQPKPETWARIAWLFTPALLTGRSIAIVMPGGKKKPLTPVEMPPFVESVDETFDVGGKSVSISIGIVKDGYRMTNGPFWIVYGHRIIRHSTIGAGKYSTLRMGGRITLGKGWALTKNKDDLSEYSEELADAILSRIEPLLMKHERLAEDVESQALKSELESMLNDAIANATKEKRKSPREHIGTVVPQHTGRKRLHYSQSQPAGTGNSGKKRHGVSIDWMEDDGPTMGEFDALANVVRLNIRHPFIADTKAESNKPALHAVAMMLVSYSLCNSDGRTNFIFEKGSFTETYANVMRTMKGKLEGKRDVA